MARRIRGSTSTSRSIRRCANRTCSNTSAGPSSAAATSSTTRLPRTRQPSCGRHRRSTTARRCAMLDARDLLPAILALHDRIRGSVVDAFSAQSHDSLSDVADDGVGDTIYAVDRVSEETLVAGLERLARDEPLVLIAEGLPPQGLVLPRGAHEGECQWRAALGPVDRTAGADVPQGP